MPCNHKDIWQAAIWEYLSYVSPKALEYTLEKVSFYIKKSAKSIFIIYFNKINLNCNLVHISVNGISGDSHLVMRRKP